MEKYTQSEGKLEVLRGRAAHVLNRHFKKTGKAAVSDFSDDERKEFDADLKEAQKKDDEEQKAAELEEAKANQARAAQDLPEVLLQVDQKPEPKAKAKKST